MATSSRSAEGGTGYHTIWADVPGVAGDIATVKRQLLVTMNGWNPRDVSGRRPASLARFFRPDGVARVVTLVAGRLSTNSIEPKETWSRLGGHLLLVNSVDQDQNVQSGINGRIAPGCGLQDHYAPALNRGDVDFHDCLATSEYHLKFRIDRVANLAVVLGENPDSSKLPCWDYEAKSQPGKYQACMIEDVTRSLRVLFGRLHHTGTKQLDAIVFPAVGTGIGGLTKDAFYQALFGQLTNDLAFERIGYRPVSQIYLLVNPNESAELWGQTKNAIASSLGDMVDQWNDADHKSDYRDWCSLLGVSLGLALIFAFIVSGRTIEPLAREAGALSSESTAAFIAAWFASALGLATAFKAVAVLLPELNPVAIQTIAGFGLALLCGSLLRGAKAFDDRIKGAATAEAVEEASHS